MALLALIPFLTIDINIDPTFAEFGPFLLTWHGMFTALGIIVGATVAVYLGKRDGIPTEIGQEIVLVAVPSAIIGARLFYVVEHWDRFSGDLPNIIFGITEGGVTLYGGLFGGVIGGVVYSLFRRWPIAMTLDIAAPGMILGQGIGRIGDLINGEHHGTASDLPWAVRYVHPDTLGELGRSVHPTAGGYEMLGDFIIFGLLVFVARRYLKAPGWVFCSYIILYAVMRFFLSYFRTDEQTILSVPAPQLISALLVGLGIILAGIFLKYPGPITPEYAERVWGDTGEDGDDDTTPKPRRRQAASA
jgi:phosphatidylglycerol---prolipoprotein diacylglyceryl transferase